MKKPIQCDVLIVGGGLVGASLAACLARDPSLSIVVLEKFPLAANSQVQHPSYDARNTALANGTCHVFEQLGVWQSIKENATAIKKVLVSDQGGFGYTQITAEEERVSALGYVVENRWVGAVLVDHLQHCDNVCWLAPGQLNDIAFLADRVQVSARTDQDRCCIIEAQLLVAADGAQSTTRERLGIEARTQSYQQVGIVTTLTPDQDHHHCAWERFTSGGPLALLPQTDNRLGVTWCVSEQDASALMEASESEFLKAIQAAAGRQAGTFTKVGKRFAYPLALTVAQEQIRTRLVVLGNSAHGMHPVAGQGFNMSMRDVAVLTQTLFEARQNHEPIGHLVVLKRYLQKRSWDQRNTLQFSDKVTRLFSTDDRLLALARNAGLFAFDLMPGAKRFLARYAMGRAVSTILPDIPEVQNHERR